MDDMEAGGAAPADGQDGSQDQGQQGYTIEIKVAADGSMTYSVEPGAEEASEEGGEDESSGTPVRNMADLMSKIKETIANGGQSPEASDSDFQAGLGEDEGETA